MRNIATTIFIILLVAVLGLYFTCFQVRQTESALVMLFGKPVRQYTEPGLKFKWPSPIEKVVKFDTRMMVFEADLNQTTTKGAVPIILNAYAVWKITEPLKFYNSIGTVKEAENKLLSQLSDTQNNIIGKYDFSDFVNSNPAEIKLDQIQQNMLADIQGKMKDYGVQIAALGIKQLKIPEDVSKDVFERMRAERNRRTQATISQGNAEAAKIRTDADSKKSELLAAAESRAKAIKGQGDAEAAKYYKLLEEDPELAMFLRDIDALKKILEKRSTIVISADSEPFKLLKSVPKIEPKK
jgi:membrane protease subunit HflC